ncbi:hypothetical protein FA95DRAFT_1588454 [Auriscalpium vulgare]|uniref:Uncharacterized protein n=1 Tax=Auriscalpium vulgare TaxID=40419 RepID=A0ACB8RZ01_9AGAM|nr:hypothetical protein FA95DRAFT_1588454 [Auriscalpium vulgare]
MSVTASNAFELVRSYVRPAALLSVTHTLPRVAKYLAFFLIALNARSLPFGWHIRVFWPAVQLRYRYLLFRLSLILKSRKAQEEAKAKWLESLSPIGQNPFDKLVVYKAWAAIDDCDYNNHLSNSSYPKTMDCARVLAALAFFPGFLRAGGWIALGATHFTFVREIPIFSKYEVRMSIASWESKWTFLIVRFVTKPTKKSGEKTTEKAGTSSLPSQTTPFPSLHTPASGTATPLPSNEPPADALKAFAEQLRGTHEPDGALVNCISINELVFKHGRITVPPALVFAADGFTSPAPKGVAAYGPENPPPHWAKVRDLLKAGGLSAMRTFYRGGWRDVPEGERWWEQALEGLEQRRVTNLKLIKGVREATDGARELIG